MFPVELKLFVLRLHVFQMKDSKLHRRDEMNHEFNVRQLRRYSLDTQRENKREGESDAAEERQSC